MPKKPTRGDRPRFGGAALPVLGVDIGRVITGEDPSTGASLLSSNWRSAPAIAGSREHLRLMSSDGRFGGRVYFISKCGPVVEARTRDWLDASRFLRDTGVALDHVIFVRKREDKADVCARLHVTHFVDDRPETLERLTGVAHRYAFCPRNPSENPSITNVSGWDELGALIAASLQRDGRR